MYKLIYNESTFLILCWTWLFVKFVKRNNVSSWLGAYKIKITEMPNQKSYAEKIYN